MEVFVLYVVKIIGYVSDWLSYAGGALIKEAVSGNNIMHISPHCEKTGCVVFFTRSDTCRLVQSRQMVAALKFWISEVEGLYFLYSKTKALISFTVTAKRIYIFVFSYARNQFLI